MYSKDKIVEKGYKAYKDGKSLADNPYLYSNRKYIARSAWWESGFNAAKKFYV